jgi:hypothetical protein
MAAREELVSVTFKRADGEALRLVTAFGLGLNRGLARITAPSTAERGLAELDRALGRRGASVTATMAWIEADVVQRMADDGLRVWPEVAMLIGALGEIDAEAARHGLKALQAAL